MNDPNADRINTPKINAIIAHLKIIREKGRMIVGWGDDEICPPYANHLVKAGLVKFEMNMEQKLVVPIPQ